MCSSQNMITLSRRRSPILSRDLLLTWSILPIASTSIKPQSWKEKVHQIWAMALGGRPRRSACLWLTSWESASAEATVCCSMTEERFTRSGRQINMVYLGEAMKGAGIRDRLRRWNGCWELIAKSWLMLRYPITTVWLLIITDRSSAGAWLWMELLAMRLPTLRHAR